MKWNEMENACLENERKRLTNKIQTNSHTHNKKAKHYDAVFDARTAYVYTFCIA